MPISFKCSCGKPYKIADEHAGKTLKCKACGKALRVPVPAGADDDSDIFGDAGIGGGHQPPAGLPPAVLRRPKEKKAPPAKSQPAEEAPVKTKTKKAPAAGGVKLGPGAVAGIALGGVVLMGGLLFVVVRVIGQAGAAATVQLPQTYAHFNHAKASLGCDYPEGWELKTGGGTSGQPPWVSFSDGTAYIEIRASTSGTAVGDIATAGGTMLDVETPEELAPVAGVHEFQLIKMEANYNDYQETPAARKDIPFGETRISTFTATEGFGSNIKGYRMSMLNREYQYNVICKCKERSFDSYQPVFDKVIDSIGRR